MMIRNQCRAYCQCTFCANNPKDRSGCGNTQGSLQVIPREGCCKDEMYMKSLRDTLRARSLMASSKNASKFIPDEQLLSSAKLREKKETATFSQMVPLRRRDRLEELLILENKARIREEQRLRAERRALGLPETDAEPAMEENETSIPGTPAVDQASLTSSQQRRLGSGRSTPSSRCSADRDLRQTLQAVKEIAESEPAKHSGQPLTREQVHRLRKVLHEQDKKTRNMVEECKQQPHLCNHCFTANVQARRLCPQMSGSVAFNQTGKVINPEDGVSFGTTEKRQLDGSYSMKNVDTHMLSGKARISNYNAHPYGSGVVFLPLGASDKHNRSNRSSPSVDNAYEPVFNNNIGDGDAVEEDWQYPGSTHNDYRGSAKGAPQAGLPANTADAPARAADLIDSGKSNKSTYSPVQTNGGLSPSADKHATSSSLWRTTNQVREADMKRFVDVQKRIEENSRKAYTA